MPIAKNGVSFIVVVVPCFSLLTIENGLEKHARNVTEKQNHKFFKLFEICYSSSIKILISRYKLKEIYQYISVGHYQKLMLAKVVRIYCRQFEIWWTKLNWN